jgi:hypothetical protein
VKLSAWRQAADGNSAAALHVLTGTEVRASLFLLLSGMELAAER